jgi:tetratricopeptide (TPR) repeat protein
MTSLSRVLISFGLVSLLAPVLFSEGIPARLAVGLQDYRNMMGFKSGDEIFVTKSDGKRLEYKMFKEDKESTSERAYNVFDVLYSDVPVLYESALTSMAEGKYEEALKMLVKVKGEKTSKSNKSFTSTETFRNHYRHKLFLCHMGLANLDEALKVFEEIFGNPSAHARVNAMLEVLPYLVKKEKGRLGIQVVTELEKLRLPRRRMVGVALNKCLFMSLNGKHSEGRDALNEALSTYGDMEGVAAKVQDAATTILVYHEKNYREGIKYFKKLMEESEKIPSWELYQKLAFCYAQQAKWEDARWNYLQAFVYGPSDKNHLDPVIKGILEATENIGAEGGDASLVQFFEKAKTTL